ncbi:MAG: hypothetical protein COB14_06675 [Alphaproteobacteria bacterium]|nr:MAG: hypothetical protein COB14_06675 [Alphaproteobacteria bacterium]
MKIIKQLRLLGLLSVLCLSLIPTHSFAEEPRKNTGGNTNKNQKSDANRTQMPEDLKKKQKLEWLLHKSITKTFEAKFPQKYKYKIFPFQFNKDKFASSAEIVSSLDGDTESKREKSVLIKVTQTFGSELTYREMKKILERTANRYVLSAKSINGVVLTNKDIKHNGFFGKDIYISYKTKNEKYGLRIHLYMTNFSKVEQVLSGPSHTMYSYRSDDFFDTIILYDGIMTKKDIPLGYGWIDYTSKQNIFTVTLPPKNKDYTPIPPKFTTKGKTEAMTFMVFDPVTEQNLRYNVYSYRSDKKYSYSDVKTLVFARHVSKFVQNVSSESLNVKNMTINDADAMKTKLVITPSERYPNISTIYLEAQYKGNTLIVQELLSSAKHAKSELDKTFFSMLKFHPEKYGTKPPAPKMPPATRKTKEDIKKQEMEEIPQQGISSASTP